MGTRSTRDQAADADPLGDGARASAPRGLLARLTDVKSILAIAALLAYAVMRTAYGRFYAPFGVTPDELGLGYVELLAQSAVGAAVMLAILGLLVSIVVAMYVQVLADARDVFGGSLRRLLERHGAAVRRRLRILTTGWRLLVLTGAAVLLLLAIEQLTGAPAGAFIALAAVGVGCVGLSAQGAARFRRGILGEPPAPTPVVINWWRRGLGLALVTVGVLTSVSFINEAHEDAVAVRDGAALHPTLFGVGLTSWGADAATLSWTSDSVDDDLRPLARVCLMYLGQSDGTLFVYSPHALGRATFRVPASAAAVRIFPRARCRPGERSPTR